MLLGHRRTTQVDEEKGEGGRGGQRSSAASHPSILLTILCSFFRFHFLQIAFLPNFCCSSFFLLFCAFPSLFLRFSSAFPLPFRRLFNNVVVAVVMCLEAGVCIDIGIGTRHFGVRLCGSSDCG
ncbi:hypothetical protein niasHT_003479 [Heterodera trifolii]|uniref:Transmembrane protein n=1 Tax=Heterodera trifolii TaxID=157864 RepID=A0ABD2LVB3_9BILA